MLGIDIFVSPSFVWFYSMSMDHSVYGSWSSSRCQGWAHSCGIGFRLDQSLLSHCHNLCATITPAHFISKTDCRLKVVWVNYCSNPSPESLAWRWPVQAIYALLLRVIDGVILVDSPFQLSPLRLSPYYLLTCSSYFHPIAYIKLMFHIVGIAVWSFLHFCWY